MLNELLNVSLSVRSYNCLMRADVTDLAQLSNWTKEDLMRVKNLGQKHFNEILNACHDKGIYLKDEKQPQIIDKLQQTAANILNYYLDFRKEIDKICVPEILKCISTNLILCDGKQAGVLCYAVRPEHYYIDCLYVAPEYRRKGLAKKAVLAFYESCKHQEIRLHIINENKVAYDFWNDVFDLEPIEWNVVDTLYKVRCLKE